MKKLLLLLSLFTFLFSACTSSVIFPSIGANMSNPITIAVDSARSRLYVNNSNYKVSYDDGSLHIVNIADPTAPVRVNYAGTPSFSGEIYLDTTGQVLYTPNRYSASESDIADNLFSMNVNEASGTVLSRTDYAAGDDPYGIAYYTTTNKLLVATAAGQVDSYDLGASLARGTLSLTSTLSSGLRLEGTGATRIVVIGNQAVVTRDGGGLWIINLDELGVAGTEPVDYFIDDIMSPRGIATDGTHIYVVDVETDAAIVPSLLILDISTLTPRTDNTTTLLVDKDDSSLVVSDVPLNGTEPQVVILGTGVAYVSQFGSDNVAIVDTVAFTQTATIAVSNEPYGMALYSPAGTATHLLVANSGDGTGGNTISIIDLITNAIVGTYP